MGECDRIKNYISDYLEQSITPTIREEIENHLAICPPCQALLNKIKKLKPFLANLNYRKCSDDFTVKLRQRINDNPAQPALNPTVKKYSLAFSFVILAFITVFAVNSFITQDSEDLKMNASSQQNPVDGNQSENPNETDIKTRDRQAAYEDSVARNDDKLKYVGQEEK